jgi:hypothetical protein
VKRFVLGAALAASLLLTGCTQDIIIRTTSGVVNVGQVTSEQATVKVVGSVQGRKYELGSYPIADVAATLQAGWADVEGTSMLERELALKLETTVTYVGTKNTARIVVDRTNVECPRGFMFATCMSQIEATQAGLIKMYEEKFSYLK